MGKPDIKYTITIKAISSPSICVRDSIVSYNLVYRIKVKRHCRKMNPPQKKRLNYFRGSRESFIVKNTFKRGPEG